MRETEFLHKKFPGLNVSPEVEAFARLTRRKTGHELPMTHPSGRIKNFLEYLAVFKEVSPEGEELKSREQRESFKKKILDAYTTQYHNTMIFLKVTGSPTNRISSAQPDSLATGVR